MIYGKRILVVLCIVAVLYFGIGSLIYAEWFFGLLWDAKFWSLSHWLDGLFTFATSIESGDGWLRHVCWPYLQ